LKGSEGGGGRTPATIFRGGAARGSPDLAVNGAPGVKLIGFWVWRDQRVMRDPPGAKAGLGEGSGGAHDNGDGSARRRIAGVHVLATRASFGLRHLAQDDQGDDVVLTEGLNGPEERHKLAGDERRAAGMAALVEEDDAGHLRASSHHGSTRGAPAKVLRGLGGLGDCQR
jgi:hypothetical protein